MPMFESIRKVQKFGSSSAMTIPRTFVLVNELKKGEKLKTFHEIGGTLVVTIHTDNKKFIEELESIIDKLYEEGE